MEKLFQQQSIMISSLNNQLSPEISYAPFVRQGTNLYIYISKVAAHYNQLLNQKKCSVMLIEDEQDCNIIFARNRVSFHCEAKLIEEDEQILKSFDDRHNAKMMEMLRKLDFSLFELSITDGRLVKGFGKAFDIKIENNDFVIDEIAIAGNHSR